MTFFKNKSNKNKHNQLVKQTLVSSIQLRSLAMGIAAIITMSALSSGAIAESTPELDAALDQLMPGTKPSSIEATPLP